MNEKEKGPPMGGSDGPVGDFMDKLPRKRSTGATIVPFSGRVVARCAACGAEFTRPYRASWIVVCRPCWSWHRALIGIEVAAAELRRGGR
jgi:hypothetical protein